MNEKLIEEAAKAMADGEHNVLGWRGHSEDEREWYRKDAAIALAVFEKALTPTDDEREDEHQAQMIAFETAKLEARNSMRHDPHVWHEALEDALDKVLPAVWHAAAGFRRSEAPAPSRFEHSPDCQPMSFCTCTEPSAERIGCNICGEALPDGEPHLCPEPQGEPSDARHVAHVTVEWAYESDCLEGECVHRDEDGEPEDMSVCPNVPPFEVCVGCMEDEGRGSDPEQWDDVPLMPWPCPAALRAAGEVLR